MQNHPRKDKTVPNDDRDLKRRQDGKLWGIFDGKLLQRFSGNHVKGQGDRITVKYTKVKVPNNRKLETGNSKSLGIEVEGSRKRIGAKVRR